MPLSCNKGHEQENTRKHCNSHIPVNLYTGIYIIFLHISMANKLASWGACFISIDRRAELRSQESNQGSPNRIEQRVTWTRQNGIDRSSLAPVADISDPECGTQQYGHRPLSYAASRHCFSWCSVSHAATLLSMAPQPQKANISEVPKRVPILPAEM